MIKRITDTMQVFNPAGESMTIEKVDLKDFLKAGFLERKPVPKKAEPEPVEVEQDSDDKPKRGRPATKK